MKKARYIFPQYLAESFSISFFLSANTITESLYSLPLAKVTVGNRPAAVLRQADSGGRRYNWSGSGQLRTTCHS
jgi:hypothetical protein